MGILQTVMKWGKRLIGLYLCCYQLHGYAEQQSCLLLGKNPSFIIQFKSPVQTQQAYQTLHLTQGLIRFTHMRQMSSQRYLFFFKTQEHLTPISEPHPGCYHPDIVETWMRDLKDHVPNIDAMMPNLILKPMEIENQDMSIHPIQWNLLSSPGGIQVAEAWDKLQHPGKPEVTVAILDTGVYDHQALNPNLIYATFQDNRYQWKQGPEDGQNAGVSFTDNSDAWALGASPSCQKCNAAEHGTHVAGIIASSGKLSYGEQVYGVAPRASILPINVFSKIDDPDICNGIKNTPCTISYTADQLNAESWLSGQSFSGLPPAPKVKVINMSIGGFGGCSRIAQESFLRLLNKKITIVVAAGNSNIDASQTFPAGCPQVLTIAATGPSGEKAWYSNWGDVIAISAPGGNSLNPNLTQPHNQIYSTIAHAYKFLQGTSMAAPMASGLVALMYAIEPQLNQKDIYRILTLPDNVTSFPGEDELTTGLSSCKISEQNHHSCGAGIMNAAKTITYMLKHKSNYLAGG